MNCILFAKMDKGFSLKTKHFKKYWKNEKNSGKDENYVSPEKREP